MARESAGAVYVTIDGDASPLLAKYAQAEQQSRAAGTRIARGLGQGLSSASGIVDQFGRAVSSGITQPMEQGAPAVQRTAVAVAQLGEAAGHSVPQIAAASGAIRVLEGNMPIRAVERFATDVLGLGPILQAAFPIVGAIALGEMVLHVAGNLAKASEEQKKFTADLKAADDEIVQIERRTESLNVQLQRIQFGALAGLKLQGIYANQQAEEDVSNLTKTAASLRFLQQELTQAKAVEATGGSVLTKVMLGFNVESVRNEIALTQKAIEQGNAKINEDGKNASLLTAEIARQKAEDVGRIQLAEVANAQRAQAEQSRITTALAEQEARQQHVRHQIAIDGMVDRQAAAVASAEEELRVAQQSEARITADLESNIARRLELIRQEGTAQELGKTPEQITAIRAQTQGSLEAAKSDAAQAQLEAHGRTLDAQARLDEARATQSRELADSLAKYWLSVEERLNTDTIELEKVMEEKRKRAADERLRTGEIVIRDTGVKAESANEVAKLQQQLTYSQQIVHSRAEQFEYAQQQAAFDQRAADLKVQQAQQELNAAIRENAILSDEQSRVKVLQDQLTLDQAIAAAKKQQLETQIRLTDLARQESLAGQIQSAVGKGPATLLDARNVTIANTMGHAVDGIASALGRAVQGGQRLGQIFSQLGRSILGEVVQQIAKIGLQMVTTALIGKGAAQAIAAAQAAEAAGVGAAWAFASVLAALPFPANVAAAPGVAAAEFAQILAIGIPKFDKGGPIDRDQLAMVHKGEYVLTADQMTGKQAMPSLPATGRLDSGSTLSTSMVSNLASQAISIGAIHMHGVRDMRDVARRLPDVLKSVSPRFSPATR